MLIEVNEIEYCKLNVKFEADPGEVDKKRSEAIELLKKEQVPGYRAGKAPPEAIKYQFKNDIESFVKSEMAQAAFQTVIAEKNIRPFGQPEFLSLQLDGNNFKCDFCVNKAPQVELKQYKNFEIPKSPVPNAVEMGEKILQELRNRNGETIPFTDDDFLQIGDKAIVNYVAFVNGSDEIVVKNDGELIEIGRCDIEAFNDNLLGMKVGEHREFIATMPSDIASPQLANKEIRFKVELAVGSKSEPAALDDELAKKIGVKTIDELVSYAHTMASARVKHLERRYLSDQVCRRLLEKNDLEVPSWLSLAEAQLLAKQNNKKWDDLSDQDKESWLESGLKNVKLSLMLNKVREEEPDAQLTDEEVMQILKLKISDEIKSKDDSKIDESLNNLISRGYFGFLTANVRDDYTIDYLIKVSNIVE